MAAKKTEYKEPKAGKTVTVTVAEDYQDLQLNCVKHKGDTLEVTQERAEQLKALKLVTM